MSTVIVELSPPGSCPICEADDLREVFSWTEPPEGETRFEALGDRYARRFDRCCRCGHLVATLGIDPQALYTGDYMDAKYRDDRLRETFDRIMALPPERSDNVHRVRRVCAMADRLGIRGRRLLDVGSGLGVFAARMQDAGWKPVALDPDPRAVAHARSVIGVEAVEGDFLSTDPGALGKYDLVTFNKVLEHVADPLSMLVRSRKLLGPDGLLYIEVPDGTVAAAEGSHRQELFVEHLHAFSLESTAMILSRAELVPFRVDRFREPSGKLTVAAFAARDVGGTRQLFAVD